MKQMQFKNYESTIKDVDTKKGIVEGYFNTWDVVDSDGDELMRGAFKKSLMENGPDSSNPRIMHLLQHNARLPLYRFTEPDSLKEDDKGLFFRSTISKTTYGRDTILLYNDGVINEHSIGINVIKEQQTGQDHNQILEVKLWEGSTVTWGANENTPVVGMKSENAVEVAEKFHERMNLITKSLRDGHYTDETFILLEIQLKQMQATYQSLVDKIQPDDSTGGNKPIIEKVSLQEILNKIKI